MSEPILAKDIMVTRLVTLDADMELRDAARLLTKHKISGAPVVDERSILLGMLSEKDLMRALLDAVYDEFPSSSVRSYMNADPYTIEEDLDVLSIAQIFHANIYRRLPVVRDGKLLGQISRRDVLKAVLNLIDPAPDRQTALLYLSALRNDGEAPFA